jgi:hypothetical protein
MTVDKIVAEALAHPPQVRALMAERLIESLDMVPGEKLSSQWSVEIQKRCREIDEATVELHDVETVFVKAYAALK